MRKVRAFLNIEKEIKWLNEMANEGWNFTGYTLFVYSFEKCEPGEYEYQTDTSDKFGKCSERYRYFMEEAGIDVVCCWGPWVMLRRKKSEEPFELYTDDESKLEHFIRVNRIFKTVAIIELICLLVNIYPAIEYTNTANIVACLIGGIFSGVFINMVLVYNNKIQRIKNENADLKESAKNIQKSRQALSVGWLFLLISMLLRRYPNVISFIASIVLGLAACFLFGYSLRYSFKNKTK